MPGGRLRKTKRPCSSLVVLRSPETSAGLVIFTGTPRMLSPPGRATVPVSVPSLTDCAKLDYGDEQQQHRKTRPDSECGFHAETHDDLLLWCDSLREGAGSEGRRRAALPEIVAECGDATDIAPSYARLSGLAGFRRATPMKASGCVLRHDRSRGITARRRCATADWVCGNTSLPVEKSKRSHVSCILTACET